MNRIALTLATALGLIAPSFGQEKKATPDLKADLAAMQGKWEQAKNSGPTPPGMKVVKDVKGDQETVSRYGADGKLIQAVQSTITLSESGGVRVLTFSNGEVTDGFGKGRKFPERLAYIYRLDGDEWHEAGGLLLTEKFAQDVPYLAKWKRSGVAVRKPAEVEGDLKVVQGEWTFTAQEVDGEAIPAILLKPLRLTIEGDMFTVRGDGQTLQEGTCTFDATQTPKTVDVMVSSGKEKGTKWLGIYKLDGDTVTFCFEPAGKKRPTEFKTTKESNTFMNVHTRVKK